jgi:hypothetical protein
MSDNILRQNSHAFPNGVADLYDNAGWAMLPAELRGSPVFWRSLKGLVDVFDDPWLREQTLQLAEGADAAVASDRAAS